MHLEIYRIYRQCIANTNENYSIIIKQKYRIDSKMQVPLENFNRKIEDANRKLSNTNRKLYNTNRESSGKLYNTN
jgi:hypothetical protein